MAVALYYWPSALKWGLPSFDISSLHVLAYAKFSSAEIGLRPTFQSLYTKEARVLPSLSTTEGDLYVEPELIIKILKENDFNSDKDIDVDTANNILPFSTLIEERLRPAVIALLWLDVVNFKDVYHSAYANACQYPFNFTTPHRLQKGFEDYLRQYKSMLDVEPKILEQMESDAKSAMNLLSEFLGDNDYLLGKEPCSLDALLFSILAPLLKLPLVNCKLQNHLRGCSNLSQYVTRILQKYFQHELSHAETKSSGDQSLEEVNGTSDWKYDWLFPISVATIAMLSYATNAGLLHGTN